MKTTNLVSINDYCKMEAISRATFYRKLAKGEVEVCKVPCSKRLWIIDPKKCLDVNDYNVLDYLEHEEQRTMELLARI